MKYLDKNELTEKELEEALFDYVDRHDRCVALLQNIDDERGDYALITSGQTNSLSGIFFNPAQEESRGKYEIVASANYCRSRKTRKSIENLAADLYDKMMMAEYFAQARKERAELINN